MDDAKFGELPPERVLLSLGKNFRWRSHSGSSGQVIRNPTRKGEGNSLVKQFPYVENKEYLKAFSD